MTRLAEEPDILELAKKLGVAGDGDPVDGILDLCNRRIDRWIEEAGGVRTVGHLESVVTARLQMVFEEVREDADFDRIKQVYAVGKRDFVFATMRHKFDDQVNPTFGALVRRKTADPDAPDRYVAVIDCRGDKLARRFFTRWHEIAHRLTTDADPDKPQYRSEHDPIEQLMDRIASHIGFYEPFFGPVFDQELRGGARLSFEVVEAVRRQHFADASFQSTLFACHRRLTTPVVYVEAEERNKAEAEREIKRGVQWLFEEAAPVAQLRVALVLPNAAAQKSKLFIAPNMRIPSSSVIHRLFLDDLGLDDAGQENLNTWEHSRGKRLADQEVWIEAKKTKGRVVAIVQPVG